MSDFVIINNHDIMADVAESIRHGITTLGHTCVVKRSSDVKVVPSIVYILFGSPDFNVAALPDNVIIFNLEQFGSSSSLLSPAYLAALRSRIIWDYSRRNLVWLREHGIEPRLAEQVRIGYSPALRRIEPDGPQDIDVLFYGTVNRRRFNILSQLAATGLRVVVLTGGFADDISHMPVDGQGFTVLPPAFGQELDGWISRARLVLNVHFYDTKIFEIARVAPLLANAKAVVAEVDVETDIEPDLLEAVAPARYEDLVDVCKRLIADRTARRQLEERAGASFAARDAADGLRTAVAETLTALFPPASLPAATVAALDRLEEGGVEHSAGNDLAPPSEATMRLSSCLVASDLNPLYLDFFPVVRKLWMEVVGLRVKLVLIADEIPASMETWAEDIVLFPPLPGVNTAFQAQCIRLLYPALMEAEAKGGAVIISDMDIVPMCRRYYTDPISGFPDNNFVVYRGNVLISDSAQIAMCYNAARPAIWGEIFGSHGRIDGIEDVRRILADWAAQCSEYDGRHGGQGWSFDQRVLFERVRAWASQGPNKTRISVLDDGKTGFQRLDRSDLMRAGALSLAQAELIRDHLYTDYHLLRPYADYKMANDRIVQILLDRRI